MPSERCHLEREELRSLLEAVAAGSVPANDACARLSEASLDGPGYVDLGYAKPDVQRGVRQGVPEVVYGAGKTAEQIAGIMRALVESGQERVLVTRLDAGKSAELWRLLLDQSLQMVTGYRYHEAAHMGVWGEPAKPSGHGYVLVACAGTSDLYCAEEAAVTAQMLGNEVRRAYDVGVSGIHRLLAQADLIQNASVIVAVAGMEGALASVIGGLAACPVIACPTSVGYGASLGGISALLSMLNSCASGVSVVNIDNGFGAGYQASLINHVGRRT